MLFLLYSEIVQLQAERNLKLTKLSATIRPYFVKFIKHNKLNTAFLHENVFVFYLFYLSGTTYHVIQLKDKTIKGNYSAMIFPRIYNHLREKQYTQHSIIMRTVQKDFLSMDIHLFPKSRFKINCIKHKNSIIDL